MVQRERLRTPATIQLWEAIQATEPDCSAESITGPILPGKLLVVLRDALEVGWDCEYIVTVLTICIEVFKVHSDFDREEMIGRLTEVIRAMDGTMEYEKRVTKLSERARKIIEERKKKGKK